MIWPFSRPSPHAATIHAIYGMIVAQARLPVFYRRMAVPDTVNGRFDMVVLHLWLVLRRLGEGGQQELAQGLFDHFCADMDANLREMGVGDLAVPRRMRGFGEAFYGRAAAYDAALADPAPLALAGALARNILALEPAQQAVAPIPARALADYARAALAMLGGLDGEAVMAAQWRFPEPVPPSRALES
ncbi:MAG: ubiquinol-cytochrome C chaperone [Xanthobacteraceae bacterium]|nr:MAG: ubiquinol-cytochrome C chaperone [Xanthobacteraceae bacterium]